MNEAYILAVGRSPITKAKYGGFGFTRIDDVAAVLISSMTSRFQNFKSEMISDVLIGTATQEGEQGQNIARNISLLAGFPSSVTAATLNRSCSSSMDAVISATKSIWCEDGEFFVAGGVESLSHVPADGFNPSLNERLMDKNYVNPEFAAQNVAQKYSVTNEDEEHYVYTSHMKAVSARAQGRFSNEIVPISVNSPDGSVRRIEEDEYPSSNASDPKYSLPQPADGASAVFIGTKKMAKEMGIKPLAKILSFAKVGVDPSLAGTSPIFSIPKALEQAKIKFKNCDLFELHELSAAAAVAVSRELGIDEKRLNVNGGSIALGAPAGMNGARMITSLVNAMIDSKSKIGVAATCSLCGQGVAVVIERV